MADSLAMMPWFPGDFHKSTRGWSLIAKGIYRELLDTQWDMGSLPVEPEKLRGMIHATVKEWADAWSKCESKFQIADGVRRNERLEQHRAKSVRLSDKRSAAGQRANAIRWQTDPKRIPIGIANGSSPSPSPSIQEKNPAEPGDLSDLPEQDPDDYLIWTCGLELIGESKRSLLGRLLKTHGKQLLATKIGELMAMTEKPRDPAGYLLGAMKKLERRFQA